VKKLFRNLLIVFLLASFDALAQSPTPNIGFESGSFNNWQCYIGTIDMQGNIDLKLSPPTVNRHTLYDKQYASVVDPYGNFPVVCPNGSNYSIRLGNSAGGAEAEQVTYTFTVPPGSQYSIIFNYAVVLENPPHAIIQQPKFTVQVYNVTDDKYIDCPSFYFAASSALPGFKLSPVPGPTSGGGNGNAPGGGPVPVYYKDWSTATIDLGHFSGKTMRLEFTTNDCTLGGHFGYAYLDVDESIGGAITGNAYCATQKSATLFAPNGFAAYKWYKGNLSTPVGSGQSLTISPPPPNNTTYAVEVSPYFGVGCKDTLYTVVNKIDAGFKLVVPDTIRACLGSSVDLTTAKITAGSSLGMTFSYFRDSLATSYLYNPKNVSAAGVYYIQGINKEGCMSILPVQVLFSNPVINVVDPPAVVFPTTVDLSKTFKPGKGLSYKYYTNSEGTSPLNNYAAVQYGGTYYIKAIDNLGCETIAPVHVVIHPPPPYVVTAPNIFTPNNDGINDQFSVSLTGIAAFGDVKIYNRYGQMVFMAKSPTEYWDGTFNGQSLPGGTYYWVLEGTDTYYNTKFTKASSITLLR